MTKTPNMDLIEISPPAFDVEISLTYGTAENFTGVPVYNNPVCFLHREAADALHRAMDSARALDYRFRIFDAYRPTEAQWTLWNHTPDPDFLADPRRGSPHSRGVAIDLTLVDRDGNPLEMGTAFDAFTPLSHHGNTEVSIAAQHNRLILLGIMTQAGWDFYRNEWWHYQLFQSRDYPLISNAEAPKPLL
jgi:D-alanyl-D-alanine dipeptidase